MTRNEKLLAQISRCSIKINEAKTLIANYPEFKEIVKSIDEIMEKVSEKVDNTETLVREQSCLFNIVTNN